MGLTILKFADFWTNNQSRFDLIFVLGDRFEMFSAVSASIPFNFDIAHIHGGEESEGSIDNMFRHSITQMSNIHFTSHEIYSKRIKKMLNDPKHVYTVGSLSIDLLKKLTLYNIKEFYAQYHIDISIPSILFTFHPETVNTDRNEKYALILKDTLSELAEKYQLIITMPNADTQSSLYRNCFLELHNLISDKIKIIENFGSLGYFSCMKHCRFLIGNSSSGIIEAASLNKWVINLGDRQKARLAGENVIHCQINKEHILEKVKLIESEGIDQQFDNPYDHGSTSRNIIRYIKLYAGI
jgi:GDP/UDP-N,N'-diacetylbacillosamine 2-epimerase (hydrolysing)